MMAATATLAGLQGVLSVAFLLNVHRQSEAGALFAAQILSLASLLQVTGGGPFSASAMIRFGSSKARRFGQLKSQANLAITSRRVVALWGTLAFAVAALALPFSPQFFLVAVGAIAHSASMNELQIVSSILVLRGRPELSQLTGVTNSTLRLLFLLVLMGLSTESLMAVLFSLVLSSAISAVIWSLLIRVPRGGWSGVFTGPQIDPVVTNFSRNYRAIGFANWLQQSADKNIVGALPIAFAGAYATSTQMAAFPFQVLRDALGPIVASITFSANGQAADKELPARFAMLTLATGCMAALVVHLALASDWFIQFIDASQFKLTLPVALISASLFHGARFFEINAEDALQTFSMLKSRILVGAISTAMLLAATTISTNAFLCAMLLSSLLFFITMRRFARCSPSLH